MKETQIQKMLNDKLKGDQQGIKDKQVTSKIMRYS